MMDCVEGVLVEEEERNTEENKFEYGDALGVVVGVMLME